jgi:2-succinyl-5-enolpyruvyl-6-hydroxy-3-cyclohexene-1-carboxylate synthase
VSIADVSLACAAALVDELVRGGVRHASVSPGSRSTPLALALSRHPGIDVHVHLDERSGGFFALGLAKALQEPVAVACTSGTAATELLPAVVEAAQSRTPLILLTADRPPRLRGTGANQTIDQVELYGRYVRAYLETPVPADPTDAQRWASIGRRAVETAGQIAGPDGATSRVARPVHVNCPVDEPLTPARAISPRVHDRLEVRAPRRPGFSVARSRFDGVLAALRGGRTLLFAGPMPAGGDAVAAVAGVLVPLIADAISNARRPPAIAAGAALLGCAEWMDGHLPDTVVLVGSAPTSRSSLRLLSAVDRLVIVDDGHLDAVPDRTDAIRVRYPPALAAGVVGAQELGAVGPGSPWMDEWRRGDAVARRTVDALLDAWEEPSEMRVARDVPDAIADGGTLFVGNSMPVRDVDAFMAPRDGLRILGNRGASGIDGVLSTALGVAASGTGPTVALLGDLSFLYDAGALLWNAGRGIDLVVVVNDNGGGQIFPGLAQRELPGDELEHLFVTPHRVDLEQLCGAAGAGHTRVERAADLRAAVTSASSSGGLHVIQVMIDAERDRTRREELRAAVAAALERSD